MIELRHSPVERGVSILSHGRYPVCVCVCVRACVRACVRVRVPVCVCV